MRRRDTVKRAAWAGALLICAMLAWSSWLQLKATIANREVSRTEGQMAAFTNDYQQVLNSKRKLEDVHFRLTKLHQMTTNRFLNASLLQAMQTTTVEDVQLVRMRIEQNYAMTEEVKTHTNETRVIPGKPATATERILVTVDGSDTSPNSPDQVSRYKEALANSNYFREALGRSNGVSLKTLSAPEFSPINGRRGVFFTLECRFPERTR